MESTWYGCNRRAKDTRKVAVLLICLAALFISGCTPKLEMLSGGIWTDSYDDGRVNVSVQYVDDELILLVRNLTYEPIAIIWPKDNLTVSDGSVLTLGYLKKKALNQDAAKELASQYLRESGKGSITLLTLPNESVSPALFIDFSTRTIKPLETAYYNLAAVKDTNDFTAPMKYPVRLEGKFIFMGPEMSGMKKGQQVTWRFAYKLLQSNEEHEAELKVKVAG